jgi:hypothetical protein
LPRGIARIAVKEQGRCWWQAREFRKEGKFAELLHCSVSASELLYLLTNCACARNITRTIQVSENCKGKRGAA